MNQQIVFKVLLFEYPRYERLRGFIFTCKITTGTAQAENEISLRVTLPRSSTTRMSLAVPTLYRPIPRLRVVCAPCHLKTAYIYGILYDIWRIKHLSYFS